MSLNRVDWSRAQDLLLKLVQILTPLTERSEAVSLVLSNRFFIPPLLSNSSQRMNIRHPVTLLTTLHSEVEQLIDGLPVSERKESSPKTVASEKVEQTPSVPISKQAQRLIDQVQDAIGKLCHSTHIKNPKEEPIRDALKRLKPDLEKIIQAVTHEGMHFADDGLPSPFRNPIPRSAREQLIRKLIAFPESEQTSPHKAAIRAEVKRGGDPSRAESLTKPSTGRDKPQEKRGEESLEFFLEKSLSGPVDLPKTSRPADRTALPGAPFTPETRTLTPGRKKKKRKPFWFRDDENSKE